MSVSNIEQWLQRVVTYNEEEDMKHVNHAHLTATKPAESLYFAVRNHPEWGVDLEQMPVQTWIKLIKEPQLAYRVQEEFHKYVQRVYSLNFEYIQRLLGEQPTLWQDIQRTITRNQMFQGFPEPRMRTLSSAEARELCPILSASVAFSDHERDLIRRHEANIQRMRHHHREVKHEVHQLVVEMREHATQRFKTHVHMAIEATVRKAISLCSSTTHALAEVQQWVVVFPNRRADVNATLVNYMRDAVRKFREPGVDWREYKMSVVKFMETQYNDYIHMARSSTDYLRQNLIKAQTQCMELAHLREARSVLNHIISRLEELNNYSSYMNGFTETMHHFKTAEAEWHETLTRGHIEQHEAKRTLHDLLDVRYKACFTADICEFLKQWFAPITTAPDEKSITAMETARIPTPELNRIDAFFEDIRKQQKQIAKLQMDLSTHSLHELAEDLKQLVQSEPSSSLHTAGTRFHSLTVPVHLHKQFNAMAEQITAKASRQHLFPVKLVALSPEPHEWLWYRTQIPLLMELNMYN